MRVSRHAELEAFTTLDGSEIREFANTEEQSLAEATVPPSGATAAHFHRTSEEIYLFTAGEGTMSLGEESFDVVSGDCVTIPPGVEHKLWNRSEGEPLVLLCCCSPPYSHSDTVLTE